MNTHDIELPPLPKSGWALNHENAFTANDMKAYARAAIEADRKRRGEPVKGEPVGYFYPWELDRSLKAYPKGFPGSVAVYASPQPLSESDIPDEPDSAKCAECGAEMIHVRPGKWQHPDCSQSFWAAEAVEGLDAGQLTEILAAYIKPEIIGEALEKLENAPWELSYPVKVNAIFETQDGVVTGTTDVKVKRVEWQDDGSLTVVIDYWPQPAEPVAADFPAKGKVHGPLGWIANNTNPEPVEDYVDIDDFIAAFIARGDITKEAFLEARQWVRDTYYNPA